MKTKLMLILLAVTVLAASNGCNRCGQRSWLPGWFRGNAACVDDTCGTTLPGPVIGPYEVPGENVGPLPGPGGA